MIPVKEILEGILPSLKDIIPNEVERKKVENELEIALATNLSSVAIEEAKGESWMQRNWRPFFSFVVIFAFIYGLVLVPLISSISGLQLLFDKSLYIDTAAWWLTIYGGGHTLKYGFDRVSDAIQHKSPTVRTSNTTVVTPTTPANKAVARR